MQTPLSRSDRVKLISAVRDSLTADSSTQADLILRTFGLLGLDLDSDWINYQPARDIRDQVTNASSDVLLDIAAHLELPGFEQEARRTSGSFDYLWLPDHIRLFMSHLSSHQAITAEVVQELRTINVDGFVAHKDIEPAAEWQLEIERAMTSCDAFVGLLHPGFSESVWTQQELGWALGRGIPLLLVRLGEDPTGFPARNQAPRADATNSKSIASCVMVSLSRTHQFGELVTDRIVESLRTARNYFDARDAGLRLEQMGDLSPRILNAIEIAYVSNSQIHNSVIASPPVQRILRNHDREIPALE